MSQQIVSIYTFNLKSGASEARLVEASAKMDTILLGLKGFHYRSLTRLKDGRWQDIVYWDSEEALAKADAMDTDKSFTDFMSLIDSHSVKNSRAVLYSSVYPGMVINADQYVEIA